MDRAAPSHVECVPRRLGGEVVHVGGVGRVTGVTSDSSVSVPRYPLAMPTI